MSRVLFIFVGCLYEDTITGVTSGAILFAVYSSNFILGLLTYYDRENQKLIEDDRYSEIESFVKWSLYMRMVNFGIICKALICNLGA